MTVRVIGKRDTHLHRVVCRNCSHELEYCNNDVKEYHGSDISGGPDGQEWIDCPNCNKKAVIRSW